MSKTAFRDAEQKGRPFSAEVQNARKFTHTPSKLHTVVTLLETAYM